MANLDLSHAETTPDDKYASLASISMRDVFQDWLKGSHIKKYPVEVILSCIDRISEYAALKKISTSSLWEYKKHDTFKPIYNRLLEAKLLRITDRNTHRVFIGAGQLYMRFLKEKPWKKVVTESNNLTESDIDDKAVEQTLNVSASVQKRQVDTETIVSSQDLPSTGLVFRKEVDWSLLNYGFTIPQSAIDSFCLNMDEEVLRGNSLRIKLMVGDEVYPATLSNVGFSNDSRKQLQVRYSTSSSVVIALRKIFKKSYDFFNAKKNNTTAYELLEGKEYVDVVCVSSGIYGLVCFTLTNEHRFETNKYSEGIKQTILDTNIYCQSAGSKYAPLKRWLIDNGNESIQMSFSEIGDLVGGLPSSAFKHPAFWANAVSHPFAVAWMEAGYKVVKHNLQSQTVCFAKGEVENTYTSISKKTVKAALIEYSNNYIGEIKTRKEMIEELSAKYGHNKHSILPADYEISMNNDFPKLFRRIDHGTYECLGYDAAQPAEMSSSCNYGNIYSLISDEEKENLMSIVSEKFKSGFRTSSNIDFERFKNYYADKYGEEFPYDATRLNYILSSDAVIFDDRAYVYNDEVMHSVRMYLEQMGSPCIYIDVFFNKYSDEFYTFSIFSIDMLRAFIEKNYDDISVKWDYILLQDDISPSDLIKEVFGERETWSFDELQERLPYLKTDTIRQTLNGVEYFRIDKGIYTHIDNMDLPDGEGEKIVEFVESKLWERDYVTANELDLSKFECLNSHCSFAAIRDAVFYKFLFNDYDKSGQVITRKGGKLRVLDIIEQYCREAETASFDELNAFEATFDPEGRTHSQCLIAGHNTMVRVSSELFVAEGNVEFDVAKIDEAIALYCHDNFIPLRKVTDFSLFPYVGYPWNLFLLESYIRRFSRIFTYDVRAVNSANIGAIVRKSFDYNEYDDILAIALANSSVRLSDKIAVGNYLFDNGYIGWRNLGKSEEKIIENAKKLREGDTA